MKKTTVIISIHLGIGLLYTSMAVVSLNDPPVAHLFSMALGTYLIIHFLVTGIIAGILIERDKQELAKAHSLGYLYVLLIGASVCFGAPGLVN